MVCHPVSSLTVSLGLLLGLLSSPLTPVKAQFSAPSQDTPLHSQRRAVQFSPPDRGAPDSAEGGATRRSDCIHVVPLMPTDDDQTYFGLTYQEHPSFYWYIASAKAGLETAEIIIERDNNTGDIEEVHRVSVALPPNLNEQEHILRFSPSANESGLEVGETYRWYLEIQCNPQNIQDPTSLAIYDGWIERVEPDPELAARLEHRDDAQEAAYLYGSAGIWFDYFEEMVNSLDAWPQVLRDLDLIAADTQIEIASPGNGSQASRESPEIQFFSLNRDRSSDERSSDEPPSDRDDLPDLDDAGELRF
ncbi:MAG: DUF928 domain-containing protein [Sodalinema sp.]